MFFSLCTFCSGVIGCGLRHIFEVGRKPVRIVINVTTPYMPITTDGKEPDLQRYLNEAPDLCKSG